MSLACGHHLAWADFVVDQNYVPNPPTVGLFVNSNRSYADLIAVGVTGMFARVDVQVVRSPGTTADLNIDVLALNSLNGSDIFLATRSVKAADVPTEFGTALIEFDLERV